MAMTRKTRLLAVGDVIQTHPREGYWGCALVLTAREKTANRDPMCHIGITTVVFTHEYAFAELADVRLEILQSAQAVRLDPGVYAPGERRRCIGIYTRKVHPAVVILGNSEVSSLIQTPPSIEIGDGLDGGWPLCGPITASLGSEAVHAWRAVHDRERLLAEVAAASASHEAMLVRIKEEERRKRAAAKSRRTTEDR